MNAAQRERSLLCVYVSVLAYFAMPFFVHAATLSVSPASGSHGVGTDFSVTIMVDPGEESVNAADGTLSFDPALLSVTGVSKDNSAFSLWTAEPSFSNTAGTVSFSGGTPTAFASVKGVLTVKFKGKAVGTAAVSFSDGSILAADGKGTDVYTEGGGGSFSITEGAPPSPPAQTFDEPGDPENIPVPELSAPGKEGDWLATSTFTISWKQVMTTPTHLPLLLRRSSSPLVCVSCVERCCLGSGVGTGILYATVLV